MPPYAFGSERFVGTTPLFRAQVCSNHVARTQVLPPQELNSILVKARMIVLYSPQHENSSEWESEWTE
eukprot:scaffold1670_cov370-Prasinococcus_capsulatus_cf.AAC.6